MNDKTDYHHGFRNLLFFLLMYLFGSPFLAPYPSMSLIAHASLTLTLFFSVYAVQKQQNYRTLAMVLLVPVVVLYWLGIYKIIPFTLLAAYVLLSVYFALLTASFVVQISRFKRVTINLIYATLCLYLIIGLFWGSLYALLHELNPGAYGGSLLENNPDSLLSIFNYFSIVTLTTLGYGDITPQTLGAGALCQLEAIIGQFFTAVVVAWLVGQFIRAEKESD